MPSEYGDDAPENQPPVAAAAEGTMAQRLCSLPFTPRQG